MAGVPPTVRTPRKNEDQPCSGEENWRASVIVPVFNGVSYLTEQLDALDRQTLKTGVEIILVDNGSTDGSVEVLFSWAKERTDATVLLANEVAGVSHARNVGARAASGTLLLYADADDVVADDWVEEMLKAAKPGMLLAGRDVGSIDELAATEHGVLSDETRRAAAESRGPQFLPFARGGNMAVYRDALYQVGMWNEEWIRGEDVELAWRLQLFGQTLYRIPTARVFYRRPKGLLYLIAHQYEFGRRAPELFRAFRVHGAPQPRLRYAIRELLLILCRIPILLFPSRRVGWLVSLGGSWGRLIGTIRSRPKLARGSEHLARRRNVE